MLPNNKFLIFHAFSLLRMAINKIAVNVNRMWFFKLSLKCGYLRINAKSYAGDNFAIDNTFPLAEADIHGHLPEFCRNPLKNGIADYNQRGKIYVLYPYKEIYIIH